MTFTYAVSSPEPGTVFILSRWLIGFAVIAVIETISYRSWRSAEKTSTKNGPTKSMWMSLMLTYTGLFIYITILMTINTHWNFVWKIIR